MSVKNCVKVTAVSKKIKRRKVINDFSMEVKEGEIVGLLGPNEAGKTTLMRIMLGLIKADEGSVLLDGNDRLFDIITPLTVGSMIEKPPLYPNLSGKKNIEIFSKYHEVVDTDYIHNLVEFFNMEDVIGKKVRSYSLGMKQRLGLIIALIGKPKLLILDEPTNGLDPEGIFLIRECLLKMNKEYGTTIIISSHSLFEMDKLCDRAIIINKGRFLKEVHIKQNENIDLENEYMNTIKRTEAYE
ncbi:MAG: ATP-binding cassette domain-containing protein [Tissierellales bacterium]|jgi:ABC-2 type transport system ATP-binding protein|nr:ATP-binding cassette domain-containing protein [Tissierellales bacterium]